LLGRRQATACGQPTGAVTTAIASSRAAMWALFDSLSNQLATLLCSVLTTMSRSVAMASASPESRANSVQVTAASVHHQFAEVLITFVVRNR